MSTVAARIKQLRIYLGVTQTQLGALAGCSKAAVSQWERGITEPEWESLSGLRVSRNVNPEWVTRGEGEMFLPPSDHQRHISTSSQNTAPGPEIRGHVPLISWVQAGQWSEAVDLYTPGDAEDWVACAASHGPQTFALRVHGDSMTAPHGQSIPAGNLIYVDPDQRGGVASGDLVIAMLCGSNEVTFKRFVQDAGRCFLQPLNPQYPPIYDEFQILGRVIGTFQSFNGH